MRDCVRRKKKKTQSGLRPKKKSADGDFFIEKTEKSSSPLFTSLSKKNSLSQRHCKKGLLCACSFFCFERTLVGT